MQSVPLAESVGVVDLELQCSIEYVHEVFTRARERRLSAVGADRDSNHRTGEGEAAGGPGKDCGSRRNSRPGRAARDRPIPECSGSRAWP